MKAIFIFASLLIFFAQSRPQDISKQSETAVVGCYSNLPQLDPVNDELSIMRPNIGSGTIKISRNGDRYTATYEEAGTLYELWLPILIQRFKIHPGTATISVDLTVHKNGLIPGKFKFQSHNLRKLSAKVVPEGFLIRWGKHSKLIGESETLYSRIVCAPERH